MSGKPLGMSGKGREALPDFWEGSGCYPGRPKRVSRALLGRPGRVGRICWTNGKGQVANLHLREGSGDPLGTPGKVGRPSWKFEKGWQALPGSSRRIGSPSEKAFLEVRKGSGGPPGSLGSVGSPSGTSG